MAAQELHLALVQTRLIWENHQANRDHIEVLIKGLTDVDVAILPEMFSTGFTMNPAPVAEPANGPSCQWMLSMSKHLNAVVTGSVATVEDGKYYNRLYWVTPDEEIFTYDKRHLFRMAGEDDQYTAGEIQCTVAYKGWNIGLFICYDLRFPVWSRNVQRSYDLAIYVANWPAPRSAAWNALLPARAIENQAYVAGVNRVGIDGNEFEFSGNSAVYSPKGDKMVQAKEGTETILRTTIGMSELQDFRAKFPVHLDADQFSIR